MNILSNNNVILKIIVIIITIIVYIYIKTTYPLEKFLNNTNNPPSPEYPENPKLINYNQKEIINNNIKDTIIKKNKKTKSINNIFVDSNYILRPYNKYIKINNIGIYKQINNNYDNDNNYKIKKNKERRNALIKFILSIFVIIIVFYIIIPLIII